MNKLLVFIKGENNSYANLASNVLGVYSNAAGKVVVKFKARDGGGLTDAITLSIADGKENEMVEKIAINTTSSRASKLVIADSVSQKGLEPTNITGVYSISLNEGSTKTTEDLTAASSLTAADSGKVFMLSLAAGFTTTLPASTAITAGWNCKFIVKTANSGSYFITEDTSVDTDILHSNAIVRTLTGNAQTMPHAAGHTLIELRTGTVKGDSCTVFFDGTNFYVDASIKSTTIALG